MSTLALSDTMSNLAHEPLLHSPKLCVSPATLVNSQLALGTGCLRKWEPGKGYGSLPLYPFPFFFLPFLFLRQKKVSQERQGTDIDMIILNVMSGKSTPIQGPRGS